MKELIDEITRTDIEILSEFYGKMKGVIANRHNKSRRFQFAMLDKNFKEAVELIIVLGDSTRWKYEAGLPLRP